MARNTQAEKRALEHCRARIESAKKFRKEEGLDDLWMRLIDLYSGKHFPKDLEPLDRIAINVAFATINVIAPSVSINEPKIVVNAKSEAEADQALITECLINYLWRHFDIHEEFRSAVVDFLVVGFGWLKTGYRYVEEEVPDPAGAAEEYDAADDDLDTFAEANPHLAGSLPSPDEVAAGIPETRLQAVEDRPFAERVSPFDVFVDPEATSLRDARWISQRVIRPLSEVRKDPTYNAAARSKVEPDGRVREEVRPERAQRRDPRWQRVTVWEFYDLHNGTMAVFAEAGDGFLVEPTAQPYKFGHPFVMMRNYDVPDRFYPMGELEAIEPLQQELNATRTSMMNDRKGKGRAWLFNPNAFDKKGRAALESKRDNRMIPVSGNVALNEAVIPLPGQTLDAQMYQYSDQIEHDIDTVTALTEYQRGDAPNIRRTATEASIIQDAANSRAADKLSKVEKVIAHVARRLIMLAQQYMTEEQVARIYGDNNQAVWVHVNPEDIAGEFDFDVEGGSTQPMNEAGRRAQATQMLQAMSPMLVPGGPLNVPEFLKFVLKNGFGIDDASRFINAPAPPVDPNTLPVEGGDPNEQQSPQLSAAPRGVAPVPSSGGQLPPEMMSALATAGAPQGP